VIVEAHGLRLELPRGWSGRAFRRSEHIATLHAADFLLPGEDGEFGDHATAIMPAIGSFLALTEYEPGSGLKPDVGLFASRGIELPLDPADFSLRGLAHPRHGQAGMQHFFTSAGRPFCLYVVVAGPRTERRRQLPTLDHVLRSLRISPRG
jgi:hypothetical protein